MLPPQRLGTGVSSEGTGFPSPWKEQVTPLAAEVSTTAAPIPLITDETPPHTTPTGAAPVTKGEWKWDKYPSHEECLKNSSYRRVEATFARVFDLSNAEECKAFAELVDANTTQSIRRKTGLKNRVRFKAAPTMYPPDTGKTNVRALVLWDVFEFVVLDEKTGHPVVSSS